MVTLENGGIVKSVHGNLYKNSIWYTMYGSKGRMECGREDAMDMFLPGMFAYRSILAGGVPMQIPNPPTNPNLNHLNFHQHVHLSYITP
ncbi:MAG: hypothetical protein J6D21_10895 [Clostridia bacterium]|nr:hypothetical protein [Clostridia bacterium]